MQFDPNHPAFVEFLGILDLDADMSEAFWSQQDIRLQRYREYGIGEEFLMLLDERIFMYQHPPYRQALRYFFTEEFYAGDSLALQAAMPNSILPEPMWYGWMRRTLNMLRVPPPMPILWEMFEVWPQTHYMRHVHPTKH